MTRGPVPKKAFEIALPVARARGVVILCQRHRGSIASFVIAGPGWTAIVYLGRTRRPSDLPVGIALQFGFGLDGLRRIPPAPGRSCEIWACDYSGNLRFFRLTSTGVVEIDIRGCVFETVAGTGGDPPRPTAGQEIPVPASDGEEVPG